MYRMLLFPVALFLLLLPGLSSAQQPGSAAYNSVYLPGHGVGDTRRPSLSWGAFAISDENGWSGWALNASSEADAGLAAIRQCTERGGVNCRVSMGFANSCAAVARNGISGYSAAGKSIRLARRDALRACGKGCEIFQERCSWPDR